MNLSFKFIICNKRQIIVKDFVGNVGTCYMCGKVKKIAIQHQSDKTENSESPSHFRLICEDCAGLND